MVNGGLKMQRDNMSLYGVQVMSDHISNQEAKNMTKQQAQGIEATVKQNLQLSDAGIEAYMTVNVPGEGDILVLPCPNSRGLYMQMAAAPESTVYIRRMGHAGSANISVLVNEKGQQYGQPMDYTNIAKAGEQVMFIGGNEYFERGSIKRLGKGKRAKKAIDINISGKMLPVRFASYIGNLTSKNKITELLKNFEGFVVARQYGKSGFIWMPLTISNLRGAFQDDNYLDIKGLVQGFSFNRGTEGFDIGKLEAILGMKKAKTIVTSTDVKYCTIELVASNGKQIAFNQVPAGAYSITDLLAHAGSQPGMKKPQTDILIAYGQHAEHNNPFSFLGSESQFSKTQRYKFEPGRTYTIEMCQQAEVKAPVQPVVTVPVVETSSAKKETKPKPKPRSREKKTTRQESPARSDRKAVQTQHRASAGGY